MEYSHHSKQSFILTSTIKAERDRSCGKFWGKKSSIRKHIQWIERHTITWRNKKYNGLFMRNKCVGFSESMIIKITEIALYLLITCVQKTLILVARLMSQSKWFRKIPIKFKTSIRIVFFVSPSVCKSIVLHGPPDTSICHTSCPSEWRVALESTLIMPEFVVDLVIFADSAWLSIQSKLRFKNVVS